MPSFFASRKPGFWIWLAAVALLALGAAVMSAMLLLSGAALTEKAYLSGQRVAVSLADGSVNANLPHSETPASPEEAQEPSPPSSPPSPPPAAPDAPKPEAPASPPASPQEEPAEAQQPQPEAAPAAAPEPESETPAAAPPAAVEEAAPLIESARVEDGDILSHAPGKGMTERAPTGEELPRISEEGEKPWQYYARAQGWKKDKPWVAVIVTGLGLGKYTTEGAVALPPDFTMSFSPYSRDVAMWVPHARSRGHEALIDLPAETRDYPAADPGPHALLAHAAPSANMEALRWSLSRVQGFIGVLPPSDEALSAGKDTLKPVLEELGKRGLLYVSGNPAAPDVARSGDAAAPGVDMLLDADLSPAAIEAQLAALEKLAAERGYAVGLARRYPVTIKTLAAWEKGLKDKKLSLVPVSAIAADRFQ